MDTDAKRRRFHLVTAAVTLALILTLGASPAAAEPPACSVKNKDSGQTYRRLSRAAKAATSGDHLAVKGTCGDAVVWHDLVIRGVHSGRMGRPVIRHLNVRPVSTLTVRSLTVRGGVEENSCGGGIWNRGDLTLRDVIVRGNRADEGGGICNDRRSTLTLNGTTAIRDNTAEYRSGGVHNLGTLIMNDLSSISGNLSRGDWEQGGGVGNGGLFVMNDASSVSGNTAFAGGGVGNERRLVMNDASSISGNSAVLGAGVHNWRRLTMTGSAAITGNTATDVGGGVYIGTDGTHAAHPASRAGIQPGAEPGSILVGVTCGPQTYANVYGNTPDDCYIFTP